MEIFFLKKDQDNLKKTFGKKNQIKRKKQNNLARVNSR
jgi:hypothetical protein